MALPALQVRTIRAGSSAYGAVYSRHRALEKQPGDFGILLPEESERSEVRAHILSDPRTSIVAEFKGQDLSVLSKKQVAAGLTGNSQGTKAIGNFRVRRVDLFLQSLDCFPDKRRKQLAAPLGLSFDPIPFPL